MKLTIVSKNPREKHVRQLLVAAKKRKLAAEVVDFPTASDLKQQVSQLGDIVYWRASSLDIRSERAAVGTLLSDKYVINDAIFSTPYVTHKFYQQTSLSSLARINTIPTYRYPDSQALKAAVKSGELKLPFIAKPNLGARGVNVFLIRTSSDLRQINDYQLFVFQNYIPNDGDWRVMVLGGRAIGVIHRTAPARSHLNNIAQGAIAKVETRKKVLEEVTEIATKAAAGLELIFCGVDVIQDKDSGEYYLLETNSAPQWQEFQSTTGINIAERLIDFCADVTLRQSKPTPELVLAYYQKSINDANAKAFHFASRLYLWSKDPWAREVLDQIQNDYLGKNEAAIQKKFQNYLSSERNKSFTRIKLRRTYYEKYDIVRRYNHILFKVLFAETIYGRDLRPLVRQLKIDAEMIELAHQLEQDEPAVRIMATRAVNFFYLLHYYLQSDTTKFSLRPEWFLELSKGFTEDSLEDQHKTKLRIYLLTHAIIGASNFYNQRVADSVYLEMVRQLEDIIRKDYFRISLDAKCEFLVCADLCGYDSTLKSFILAESAESLAGSGNFIVDTLNASEGRLIKDQLWQAEHRNVLYLMSTMPFTKGERTSRSLPKRPLEIIGRKAFVSIPKFQLEDLAARVDTGAFWSALHCTNVREEKGLLLFNLLDPQHPAYDHKPLSVSEFKKTPVKNTSGAYENRYVVSLDIVVKGKPYQEHFTLADRSHMMFPVLLGRTFLKKRFLVDSSRLIIDEPHRGKETSI